MIIVRNKIPTIYALIIAISLAGCSGDSSTPSCSKNYYVATNGDDSEGDGTSSKPFNTINRARAVVSNDKARGQCTINVNIKSGTYVLSEAINFGPDDSGSDQYPVVYQADPSNSAPVVISGGIEVNDLACSGGSCTSTVSQWSAGTIARQFYVDDARIIRARTNYDPSVFANANQDWAWTSTGYAPAPGRSPTPPSRPEWAEIVTAQQWRMMRCPLTASGGANLLPKQECWNNAQTFYVPFNFQILSWIENAYEYLQPGMWFLNPNSKQLTYMPSGNSTPSKAVLASQPTLLNLQGSSGAPVQNITFKGLQFSYATWNDLNTDGYVSDQSGNFIKGTGYGKTLLGHQKIVYSTPGNVSLSYAKRIIFDSNIFSHLGAVALSLGTGSQYNTVINNRFTDISSAAIQVGGVALTDARPSSSGGETIGNQILNNSITYTGQDYYDSASIYVGFTAETLIKNNTISHTPWAGIAIGWGWGLLDQGGFPGAPGANVNGVNVPLPYNYWGVFDTPTIVRNNKIISNEISYFLEQMWDGGAIYINGSQGENMESGLLVQLNVAHDKRPKGAGNTYYTDGGSQHVYLDSNASYSNPVGYMNLGTCATPSTWTETVAQLLSKYAGNVIIDALIALFGSYTIPTPLCLATDLVSYGADMGGCVPRGNLTFINNYLPIPNEFFDICTNSQLQSPPIAIPNLSMSNNAIVGLSDIPAWILRQAGVQ
ncbi:MAG: hypothetical protein B7Y05_02290 [Polynucleobacter sp. 24-46-87]|nr:MAG: hypothetical protein B7Y67_04175 [Polynucleobacter sp. 35-46-11]OZA15816.1 MAG: hypothetical protein B7Y05_02290 [Polynucleobacter sp. 24-46-87]